MGDILIEWEILYSWEKIVPGTWTVLPWSKCIVLINKINVGKLVSCTCTKNINFGAGTCEIVAADPDRTQYLLFQEGDEIEIYMAEEEVINKVWGGYVEGMEISDNDGKKLAITGNEYASRLLNQKFTDTFSNEELSDVLADILANQSDFTYTGISTTTGKLCSGEFSNDRIFDALQKFCDQHEYYFWVDNSKVFYTAHQSEVVASPDSITEGDNVTRKRNESRDKEYLCNEVVIIGTGGVEGTSDDTASQTLYGTHSRKKTVGGLDTAAAVQTYADRYIDANKSPSYSQTLTCKLLPFTDPREYLTVTCSELGLSGDYKCVKITHKYGAGLGLSSEVTLTSRQVDNAQQQGEIERRIIDLETEAY